MNYVTLRIRKETQRKLKIVAALSEESMLETLERLVSQEHDRLQGRQKDDQSPQNPAPSYT
jgi:hypothetical protein